MPSYVRQARLRAEERRVDGMPAIGAGIETWRGKKEIREAQARYNGGRHCKRREPEGKACRKGT